MDDYIFETEDDIKERIQRNIEERKDDEKKRQEYLKELDDKERDIYHEHLASEEERKEYYIKNYASAEEVIAHDFGVSVEEIEKADQKAALDEATKNNEEELNKGLESKSFSRMEENGFRSAEDKLLWENSYMHPEHGRMNRLTGEPWKDGDFEAIQKSQNDIPRVEKADHKESDVDVKMLRMQEQYESEINARMEEAKDRYIGTLNALEYAQDEYGEMKPSALIDDERVFGDDVIADFMRADAHVGDVVSYDRDQVLIIERYQEVELDKHEREEELNFALDEQVELDKHAREEELNFAMDEPEDHDKPMPEVPFDSPEFEKVMAATEAERVAQLMENVPFDSPEFERAYMAEAQAEATEAEPELPEWARGMMEEHEEKSASWMDEIIAEQEYHQPGQDCESELELSR